MNQEKEENKELSNSLVETISSSDLTNIGKDILEIGIDRILADGLLKEIPVINVATGFWKTGIAIRDYRFIKKLLYFLNESSKLSINQRQEIIEKLEDNEYQSEAGEKLISIIDNLETKSKAKLIGKAICLFGNNLITRDEFWRISFVIEKLPLSDINALKNWKIDGTEELDLFFAQRMNELLFDYTLDSYKYYALNIYLLLFEARSRLNKIKDDLTNDVNLKDIVDEINLKAKTDIVTKSILGPKYQIYFPLKIENDKSKFRVDLEILSNKLSLNQLIPKLFELIEKELDSGSKIKLNILASQLVTALINVGFHQSYIYHQVNFYFFKGRLPQNRGISHFFKYFEPERKEFIVYIKVSDSFNEIKELCSKYSLEILSELALKNINEKTKEFISSKNENEVFAKCLKIRAFDSQSARLKAIKLLNTLASFFSYFHHKNPPTIDRSAIIGQENKHFLIEPTTSPMAKGEDMSHKAAAEMLEAFLKKFTPNDTSRLKFNRAVNLHSLAIQSDSNENRLLNLWITYETLFGTGKTTTVVHIINSLGHITSLKYFERIFDELSISIYNWNKTEFDEIKKITGESSDTDAVCSFCLSTEYDNERKSLYGKLNDFPLLRYRIDDLNKNLNSTKNILSYLEKHNQRIRWHIKRIYRTRNNIVHDGRNSRNLDILVENAHSYFDIFMDEFITDNILSNSLNSIPQAVNHYKTLNENWIRILKDDVAITKDNFKKYLLHKEYCS